MNVAGLTALSKAETAYMNELVEGHGILLQWSLGPCDLINL